MASYNSDNTNIQTTINLINSIPSIDQLNIQPQSPGLNGYTDPRVQMLLFQLYLQQTQSQPIQTLIARLQLQQLIKNSVLANPYFISGVQGQINPVFVTGQVNQINNYNLNFQNAAQSSSPGLGNTTTMNSMYELNKTRDESSIRRKENFDKNLINTGESGLNFKENSEKIDSDFSLIKRNRNGKFKQIKRRKQSKTKNNPFFGGSLFLQKKVPKKEHVSIGRKNKLTRANELLQDSLLAFMDKGDNSKPQFGLNEFYEDKNLINAIEDPRGFITSHFPIQYPLKKKDETKYPIEEIKYKSNMFLKFDKEIPEILHTSDKPKKLWTPCNHTEINYEDFLFKIEKIWPFELVPFSIEFSLEYLMSHDYNFDKVENLIKFRHNSFKQFINYKKLASEEVEKISTQYKKSYQLRKRLTC